MTFGTGGHALRALPSLHCVFASFRIFMNRPLKAYDMAAAVSRLIAVTAAALALAVGARTGNK
jgi:hypothetical protein